MKTPHLHRLPIKDSGPGEGCLNSYITTATGEAVDMWGGHRTLNRGAPVGGLGPNHIHPGSCSPYRPRSRSRPVAGPAWSCRRSLPPPGTTGPRTSGAATTRAQTHAPSRSAHRGHRHTHTPGSFKRPPGGSTRAIATSCHTPRTVKYCYYYSLCNVRISPYTCSLLRCLSITGVPASPDDLRCQTFQIIVVVSRNPRHLLSEHKRKQTR